MIHVRPPQRTAIASTAQDLQVFWSEYNHFLVEDYGNNQILIGKLTDLRQWAKTCEINPTPTPVPQVPLIND